MRDAEIFPDVPTGSEGDEILKQLRETRAKYVRSSDKDTESEDERVENVPQLSEFPGKSSTKHIETNEKKEGNEVAALKQCEENVLMRETSNTKFSSTFEKGGKMEKSKNGGKLGGVVKKGANNVPSTPKSDSELSSCDETFSKNEELVRSLYRKESSAIGTEQDIIGTEYYEIIDQLSSLNLQVTDLRKGQKKILEKLECISEQKNRQPQSPEEVETIDIWHKLPLKNEVALQELEHKLNEDDKYRKKLVKELANIGDRDTKYLASKIMQHTFTNELAVHYSWSGTEEKKAFKDLMICKVILVVLKKHYQNFTEEEISRPIKTWFNNASARSDARKLR